MVPGFEALMGAFRAATGMLGREIHEPGKALERDQAGRGGRLEGLTRGSRAGRILGGAKPLRSLRPPSACLRLLATGTRGGADSRDPHRRVLDRKNRRKSSGTFPDSEIIHPDDGLHTGFADEQDLPLSTRSTTDTRRKCRGCGKFLPPPGPRSGPSGHRQGAP